jgi:hypothetical protein
LLGTLNQHVARRAKRACDQAREIKAIAHEPFLRSS